jgi:hypothetical protein
MSFTFGRPSCGSCVTLQLRCGALRLRCGRAWGANVRTCLALSCGRALRLHADVRLGAQLADEPCVALGRPTCGRALYCVYAPILQTCLVLRLGAQIW